jgi:predicted lipoprotein with Yx(FWY)xxD motif
MRLVASRFMSRPALSRLAVVAAAALVTACSTTVVPPTLVNYGLVTDPSGLTLYTFDRDTAGSGKSVCNGPCAANWPAFAAPATAVPTEGYSIVIRDDGSRQWALKGKPLYTFVKDSKPGDKNGDGFLNNQWHVVRP